MTNIINNELLSNLFDKKFDTLIYKEFLEKLLSKKIEQQIIPKINTEELKNIPKIEFLGELIDKQSNKIAFYNVELPNEISIEKGRGIQRKIISYLLEKKNLNSIVCTFYNLQTNTWRISFNKKEILISLTKIGNIKLQNKYSPFIRYSFLVGENQQNFTAKKQLSSLFSEPELELSHLENVFSVEKVTDNFFNDYRNLYISLTSEIDNLRKQDKKINDDFKKNQIKSENFAEKTLGQIVFLFFLQKKGWLGIERNENGNFKKWGSGSRQFLNELYNKYKSKKIKGTNFYNDILEPIFYDALNNPEDFYEKLNCKMPFLNGGLFEPINNYNWYETNIVISDQIIENILSIFSQYNFTVTEDQPLDREVAVDPEMLGKVFEKLLSEKERKREGAHFTPREVVQNMCRKSLYYFITTKIGIDFEQNDFDLMFRLSEDLEDNQQLNIFKKTKIYNFVDRIDLILRDIKICDPAIGSGAFPVSMMIEITNLRNLFNLISGREQDLYALKRNFIENNLYGVDKKVAAVDIAKLRLWLSLVVDEKSFEKINPLPNLDYKIMQGNSLVEKFNEIDFSRTDKQDLFGFGNDELSLELFKLLDTYYNTSIRKNKEKLKESINSLFEKLVKNLINQSGKNIPKNNLKKLEEDIKNILDQKNEREYFLWNIFFHKIFKENNGFDLIISNPPYIKEDENKDAFTNLKDSKYYLGKMNIWHFMTCKSLDLLNENGILCFIAQNNWFTNSGAKKLRSKIVKEAQILEINDFSNYMVFESAQQQTMIMILLNSKKKSKYNFLYSKVTNDNFKKTDLVNFFNNIGDKEKISTSYLKFDREKYINKYLIFSENKIDTLLNKIELKRNFKLNKNEISQGIVGPQETLKKKTWIKDFNQDENYKPNEGIFFLNLNEKNQIKFTETESKLIKPSYIPEDLQKYYTNAEPKYFVIYTESYFKNINEIKNYPNIKKHLDRFKKVITSDNKPYGLHRSRNSYFFVGKKILSIRKCNEPFFSLIEKDSYVFARFNIIKTERLDLEFLTILLNSSLIKFYLKNRGKMQGSNFQIDSEPLLLIPIKVPENTKKFNDFFKQFKMGSIKEDELKIKTDNLIYDLYDISNEEVKLILSNY
jgi:adenine-specific DNA-methyltransferase